MTKLGTLIMRTLYNLTNEASLYVPNPGQASQGGRHSDLSGA